MFFLECCFLEFFKNRDNTAVFDIMPVDDRIPVFEFRPCVHIREDCSPIIFFLLEDMIQVIGIALSLNDRIGDDHIRNHASADDLRFSLQCSLVHFEDTLLGLSLYVNGFFELCYLYTFLRVQIIDMKYLVSLKQEHDKNDQEHTFI